MLVLNIASVTLNEENHSGARGILQIVQHIEWNYVMITGTVKGLSPDIYGITVLPGNACLKDVSCITLFSIFGIFHKIEEYCTHLVKILHMYR